MFKVGDTLILKSPHAPGRPAEVIYRGKIGDTACVILGGYQMSIPLAWLHAKESEEKEHECLDDCEDAINNKVSGENK